MVLTFFETSQELALAAATEKNSNVTNDVDGTSRGEEGLQFRTPYRERMRGPQQKKVRTTFVSAMISRISAPGENAPTDFGAKQIPNRDFDLGLGEGSAVLLFGLAAARADLVRDLLPITRFDDLCLVDRVPVFVGTGLHAFRHRLDPDLVGLGDVGVGVLLFLNFDAGRRRRFGRVREGNCEVTRQTKQHHHEPTLPSWIDRRVRMWTAISQHIEQLRERPRSFKPREGWLGCRQPLIPNTLSSANPFEKTKLNLPWPPVGGMTVVRLPSLPVQRSRSN